MIQEKDREISTCLASGVFDLICDMTLILLFSPFPRIQYHTHEVCLSCFRQFLFQFPFPPSLSNKAVFTKYSQFIYFLWKTKRTVWQARPNALELPAQILPEHVYAYEMHHQSYTKTHLRCMHRTCTSKGYELKIIQQLLSLQDPPDMHLLLLINWTSTQYEQKDVGFKEWYILDSFR